MVSKIVSSDCIFWLTTPPCEFQSKRGIKLIAQLKFGRHAFGGTQCCALSRETVGPECNNWNDKNRIIKTGINIMSGIGKKQK